MRVKDAVGRFGEQVAAEYLERSGLRILARNWRCQLGEIDILAADGPVLVVAEVKTRSSLAYGRPAEAVAAAKTARLRRLAAAWLAARDDSSARWEAVRFDVISVLRSRQGAPPEIDHLRGAF